MLTAYKVSERGLEELATADFNSSIALDSTMAAEIDEYRGKVRQFRASHTADGRLMTNIVVRTKK